MLLAIKLSFQLSAKLATILSVTNYFTPSPINSIAWLTRLQGVPTKGTLSNALATFVSTFYKKLKKPPFDDPLAFEPAATTPVFSC